MRNVRGHKGQAVVVQNIQDGCGILHISCMIDDDIDDY
jgi:hypothetical protein